MYSHFVEPRLDDFHRPYDGEETSSIADLNSIQNLINSASDQADLGGQRQKRENVLLKTLLPNLF